ncbi:MAG: protein-export chaperone SecB [Xanthomonadaceae bacterium]|nr:protein-export chaperone SecB [Xanthomonadaceae bacterium]
MADDIKQGGQQQSNSAQTFHIAKIYLKDASMEVPNAPKIFQAGEWAPEISVDLATEGQAIDNQTYEVVLRVTVTAKLKEMTAYLCEVHQSGIFQLSGFDAPTLNGLLGSYCPSILFPYAREAVSDLVAKAGFPQMLLGPVNFDALYAQRLQQAAAQQKQQQAGPSNSH